MSVPLYKFASNENIFVCKVTKVKCYKDNNTMVLCTLCIITSYNTHYCVYIWTLMNILCIHLRSNQMENVFEDHNMTNPHLFRCDLVGHSLFMVFFSRHWRFSDAILWVRRVQSKTFPHPQPRVFQCTKHYQTWSN